MQLEQVKLGIGKTQTQTNGKKLGYTQPKPNVILISCLIATWVEQGWLDSARYPKLLGLVSFSNIIEFKKYLYTGSPF